MYKSSTELIKNELPKEVVAPLYRIFENANIIYKEIINTDFYKSIYNTNIKGRIATYSVFRQFDPKYLMKNFPFTIRSVKMPFGQLRLELRRGNILLTIGKTKEKHSLPCKSKYKENYAANNWGLGSQLYMEFTDNHELLFKQEPYYGIIAFGIAEDELDFVDILIPDHEYKTILDIVELKPKFKVYNLEDIENDDERIISIENIKKEILNRRFISSEGE